MEKNSRILIKKAELTDIDKIFEIENKSIGLWSRKQFYDELSCPFAIFLVAEIDNETAAYSASWKVAGELQINSIAVKKSFRGMGVGRKLIDESIKLYSENGPEKIVLEVAETNSAAIKFYEKCGFSKIGVRKSFYINDDALIMEKIL